MSSLDPEILSQLAEADRKLAYIGNQAPVAARAATRAGAKYLSVRMKEVSPVSKRTKKVDGKTVKLGGGMKRSIGWSGLKQRGNIAASKAGFDVGKRGRSDATGSHGHLYVSGTAMRWTGFKRIRNKGATSFALQKSFEVGWSRKAIKYTGAARPHMPSFIKTTTEANLSTVSQIMFDELKAAIEKSIVKQGL